MTKNDIYEFKIHSNFTFFYYKTLFWINVFYGYFQKECKNINLGYSEIKCI